MNLSFKLTIVFVIGVILGFSLYEYLDSLFGLLLLFASVIGLMLVIVFNKEVVIYGHKRKRENLGPEGKAFLESHFPMLALIPVDKRELFFQRVSLFKVDKEFVGQGMDGVPYQAILLCGAYAAFIEWNRAEYGVPLPSILAYIFYNHPFPSPQYQQSLHISETHTEDGAMLFSIPHLIKGSIEPDKYFNTGLYEAAKLVTGINDTTIDLPEVEELCNLAGYTLARFEKYLGLPFSEINLKAFAIVVYFTKPDSFRSKYPRASDQLNNALMPI